MKGINFLTLMASGRVQGQRCTVPLNVHLVAKTATEVDAKGKTRRVSPVTKNEIFRNMMTTAVHHERVKFRHVLADSWFSSCENMEFVKKKLKKDFVMPIKSNRLVAFGDGSSRSKLIYKRVDALPWTPELSVPVRLKDVEIPLLLTRAARHTTTTTHTKTGHRPRCTW